VKVHIRIEWHSGVEVGPPDQPAVLLTLRSQTDEHDTSDGYLCSADRIDDGVIVKVFDKSFISCSHYRLL
jgi:hypothetical protein